MRIRKQKNSKKQQNHNIYKNNDLLVSLRSFFCGGLRKKINLLFLVSTLGIVGCQEYAGDNSHSVYQNSKAEVAGTMSYRERIEHSERVKTAKKGGSLAMITDVVGEMPGLSDMSETKVAGVGKSKLGFESRRNLHKAEIRFTNSSSSVPERRAMAAPPLTAGAKNLLPSSSVIMAKKGAEIGKFEAEKNTELAKKSAAEGEMVEDEAVVIPAAKAENEFLAVDLQPELVVAIKSDLNNSSVGAAYTGNFAASKDEEQDSQLLENPVVEEEQTENDLSNKSLADKLPFLRFFDKHKSQIAGKQAIAKGGKQNQVATVGSDISYSQNTAATKLAAEEVRRLTVLQQLRSLEARKKYEKGMQLYDNQEYSAALKLFNAAEQLDPVSQKIQDAIRLTAGLVGGTGDDEARLAEHVLNKAMAREQYSAVYLRSLLEGSEHLLNEVKRGTAETKAMVRTKRLSVDLTKVNRAMDRINKVDIMLQGEVGGSISRADFGKRTTTLRNALLAERKRINAELETISRVSTLKETAASAKAADESLKQQVSDLMQSTKFYLARNDYAKAREIAYQVMQLDPNYAPAQQAFEQARNLEHDLRKEKSNEELQRAEDNWIMDVEEMAVPTTATVTYPSDWEQIKLRAKRVSADTTQEDWKRRIEEKLDSMRVTLEFADFPLKDAIDYLRSQSGINIVLDKEIDPTMTVNLTVKDMTLGKAIDWLLRITPTKLYRELRNEALFISATPKSTTFMKLYPVHDLTRAMRDYNGPQMSSLDSADSSGDDTGGGLFGDDDDDDDDADATGTETAEALVEKIQQQIAPETWTAEEGNVSIDVWQNDYLIVMQSASVHNQINDYLAKLRASSKQQILVGARFLTIQENFLEQIGVSWQDRNSSILGGTLQSTSFDPGGTVASGANITSSDFLGGGDYPGTTWPTAGVGTANYRQMGPSGRRTGSRYVVGTQVLPGVGAANTGLAGNGGLDLDLRYLSRRILSDFEINAVVQAVRQNQTGSILHNPRLLVANGHNAYTEVSTRTSYVSTYTYENNIYVPETDEYRQGIVFDVRPVISFDKKYITIRLRPTMSAFIRSRIINLTAPVSQGGGNVILVGTIVLPMNLPQLRMTRVWTYATVPNGGSIMVGGLIQDNLSENSSKIPILSNVPLLGRLARSDSTQRSKQNLLILLNAKIVELE